MRQVLVFLATLVLATSLYAGRDVNMNISFDDEGDVADCSGLRVRIGGERAAVASEDIPFHGSALRVSAEEGHGGIRVFGSRGQVHAADDFDVIVVLASRRVVGTELAMQVLVWSPLAAALTAVAGAIVLTILRPIMELRPTS